MIIISSIPLDVAIVKLLSSGANVPVVYAGKVIEDAGKWFNGAGNWFGDRAADYSKVLANTQIPLETHWKQEDKRYIPLWHRSSISLVKTSC